MTMWNCWAKIIPVLWCSALLAQAPRRADLAELVRAYRQAPSPAAKSAIVAYAAAHPRDANLANLALGVAAYEQQDFAAAVTHLQKVKLPAVAD